MNTDFLFFSFSSIGVFFFFSHKDFVFSFHQQFFLFSSTVFLSFHQWRFSSSCLFINKGYLFSFCNNEGFLFPLCINRVVFLLLFASIGSLLLFSASIGFFLFFLFLFEYGIFSFFKVLCFAVNVFCSSSGLFFHRFCFVFQWSKICFSVGFDFFIEFSQNRFYFINMFHQFFFFFPKSFLCQDFFNVFSRKNVFCYKRFSFATGFLFHVAFFFQCFSAGFFSSRFFSAFFFLNFR